MLLFFPVKREQKKVNNECDIRIPIAQILLSEKFNITFRRLTFDRNFFNSKTEITPDFFCRTNPTTKYKYESNFVHLQSRGSVSCSICRLSDLIFFQLGPVNNSIELTG